MELYVFYCYLIISTLNIKVFSYHDTDNVRYDCWPLGAIEGAATISCGGLGLAWPEEPPDEVEKGEKFNVTYQALISDRFYKQGIVFPNKTEVYIRNLCQNVTCPERVEHATKENCCVWHANIHTCHPSVTTRTATSAPKVCGPWVANNGQLSTHTDAEVGFIDTVFFGSDVKVDFVGLNFIIAHLRVGNIQIALGKPINVVPQRVCGDGICSASKGETCDTCATDCCGAQFPVGATAAIVVIALLLPGIILLAGLLFYFFQRRKLFFDEGWIINYNDIQRDYRGVVGSMVSLKNLRYFSDQEVTNINSAPPGAESFAVKPQKPDNQIFTLTGVYEGRTVAIKRMNRQDLVLTNAIRREVLRIRILDHPNLCKFIGATVKSPNNLCIITEYCPKGSLNDVLQNDDIPLNWGFRFSFASDIARGMAYLHSKKLYHGRLTSSNCTIDDRWVVKISDYGLPSFRVEEKMPNPRLLTDKFIEEKRRLVNSKLYMPPEIRAAPHESGDVVAPTTDVYSYSILLVEIATRMDPFSEDLFLDTNLKPVINKSDLSNSDSPCPCPMDYLALIDRCWSYVPSNRPTFDQIKKILDRINPNRESPVDMMMIMMEKYSKHLEVLVAERTQELIAEQKKTANLLYSMLPQQVADDLKHGKAAPATTFQSATIFFSDIVGFTSMASTSTPLQIVKLLNDLYTTFDAILDRFDVYKVETIGDAYMVVSGVPRENGTKHAGEIASMALSLLAACKKFKIPHRPDTKLEIRIGIHSGPVCAGVVGLKMPRYCLFGDTVNTASRMETTSQAMKIQCSDTTYQLLQVSGIFFTECRGNITVKGKGSMVTWWIVGQDHLRTTLASPQLRSIKSSLSSPSMLSFAESMKSGKSTALHRESPMLNFSGSNMVDPKLRLPGSVVEQKNSLS